MKKAKKGRYQVFLRANLPPKQVFRKKKLATIKKKPGIFHSRDALKRLAASLSGIPAEGYPLGLPHS